MIVTSTSWINKHTRAVRAKFFFGVLGIFLILSGCATGPSGPSGQPSAQQQVPDWVLQRPAATGGVEFFVAAGTDATGNTQVAEEAAAGALMAEINQYLGVDVSLVAATEQRATLEEFESEVRNTVTMRGDGRITGLRIQDRFETRGDRGVTVYILAAYDRAALEQERRTREALIQEQEDAVSVPENQGRAAFDRRDGLGALTGFSQASAAALDATIRNADIRFERNMRSLAETIQAFEVTLQTAPRQLVVSAQPQDPFVVQVTFRGAPAAGLDVRATFSEAVSGGRTRVQNLTFRTNDQGIATILLPPPTLVGNQTLTISLDVLSFLRPLENVPRNQQALSNALFDNASSKQVRVNYQVISLAREIPMGIFVIDTDIAGNPTGLNDTAQGIVQELSAAGFQITPLSITPAQVGGATTRVNPATVIQLLDNQGVAGSNRIILGRVSIVSVEERDGFLVRVAGSVEVYDRNTGMLLFSQDGFKLSQGASSTRAISSAFTSLGRDFGTAIARGLR